MPLHVPDRDKPLKYRELRSKLQKNGVVEVKKRGKGAHRMFLKIIEGRPVVDFVTCHSEGHEISRKLEFYKFSLPLPPFFPPPSAADPPRLLAEGGEGLGEGG